MNIHTFNCHARRYIAAVLDGDLAAASQVLQKHPELADDRDDSKETPLHWLAVENELEGVRLLIERGADTNTRDRWGSPVLTDVAGLGLADMCRLLLANGADPASRHEQYRGTALHAAAQHCDCAEVIDILIEAGAKVDAKDHLGWTPLYEAVSFGNIEAARRLLARGAAPDFVDKEGLTAASELGEAGVEFVELFFSHGARFGPDIREELAKSGGEAVRMWLDRHKDVGQ